MERTGLPGPLAAPAALRFLSVEVRAVLVACWSPKGGVGTTVVAAALALVLAADAFVDGEVLLVDLAGDVPAALGLPDVGAGAAGASEWLAAAPDVAPDALGRIETAAAPGLALLRRGVAPLPAGRGGLLAGMLSSDPRRVVVDCGRIGDADADGVAAAVATAADRSLLVLRPCFLAVHRAAASALRPSGIVLVDEPGRSLRADDLQAALGVPVVATVRVTEQVARTVDAGLLTARLPRSLSEDVRGAA